MRIAGVIALVAGLYGIVPSARAADPITIGFGMALTGSIAANGRVALIAMKLWEADINRAGCWGGR
jgi:branched-chain amino acid transport system substrate-binding protein